MFNSFQKSDRRKGGRAAGRRASERTGGRVDGRGDGRASGRRPTDQTDGRSERADGRMSEQHERPSFFAAGLAGNCTKKMANADLTDFSSSNCAMASQLETVYGSFASSLAFFLSMNVAGFSNRVICVMLL